MVATLAWSAPLTGLAVLTTYTLSPALTGQDTLWGVAEYVFGSVGLMVPFAVFSGGLAFSSRSHRVWRMLPLALGVAIAAYVCSAVVTPIAEYNVDRGDGVDLQAIYPFGPETPAGLVRLRAANRSQPAAEHSFLLDSPHRWPPNWLTHRLHQGIAFALFAVPNALLGLLVGVLTAALPPPVRRRRRWAAGLVAAVLFFVPVVALDSWVTADATRSGVVSGWLPLLVPILLVAILWPLARRVPASGRRAGVG